MGGRERGGLLGGHLGRGGERGLREGRERGRGRERKPGGGMPPGPCGKGFPP